MREIVEVGLKNFQSHKDTVVNFESGFNVVVGPSDSGKTAIKRGIESVLYNKYVGAEYIREGEKSFSNYILFNDGLKITREKGGRGLNRYLIEYPDGNQLELNNFGVKVPQEVLDAHGMYLVELGKETDSLNCAYQLSGPFFLQNTAGERAAIIGSIAKTQVIDEAVSDTMSKHREKRKELKLIQATNKQLEKSIDSYNEWIDEARVLMNSLEEDYQQLAKKVNSYEKYSSTLKALEENNIKAAMERSVIDAYQDIQLQESRLNELLDKFAKVKNLENKFNRMDSDINRKQQLELITKTYADVDIISEQVDEVLVAMNKYNSISKKVELINKNIVQQNSLQKIINGYNGTDDVIEDISKLEKDIARYNELSKKLNNYDALMSRKERGTQVVSNLNMSLNKALRDYQNALEVLGKCPVCFSIITEEQFSNIKENLA